MAFDGLTRSYRLGWTAALRKIGGISSALAAMAFDARNASLGVGAPILGGDAIYTIAGTAQTVISPPDDAVFMGGMCQSNSVIFALGDKAERTVDAVNPGDNTLTISGHGYVTGDAPTQFHSADVPSGLVSGQLYFVGDLGTDLVALYDSRADAVADTNRVAFTASGSGSQTLGSTDISAGAPAVTDTTVGNQVINAGNGDPWATFRVRLATDVGGKPRRVTVQNSAGGAILHYWFEG